MNILKFSIYVCLRLPRLLLPHSCQEALVLEDLAYRFHLHQEFERDDHQHQLGLIDLVVQPIQEWEPEDHKCDEHEDQEADKDGESPLYSHRVLPLNILA